MASVVSVSSSPTHTFSKQPRPEIRLIAGWGVEGDAHAGRTVQHRYHVLKDRSRLNHTQVHLLQSELFRELADGGFRVEPGEMGENITTAGIDLLTLPTAALLRIGETAVLELTGLRSPCQQIDRFQSGLRSAVEVRVEQQVVWRKAGVMAVVIQPGNVRPGDPIALQLPPEPHRPLGPV